MNRFKHHYSASRIHKGDLVSIQQGALFSTGSCVPEWFRIQKWFVAKVYRDKRVLLCENEFGSVISMPPIEAKHLAIVVPAKQKNK